MERIAEGIWDNTPRETTVADTPPNVSLVEDEVSASREVALPATKTRRSDPSPEQLEAVRRR